ncbi:MAG TPA: NYN domain-containing protein [Coleofasciculaceae cyanobacterium]
MPTSDSAAIQEISRLVYQAILIIQQQQPELLKEKYQKVQWDNSRNQSIFMTKLNEELSKVQDWDARILKLRRYIQAFVVANTVETPILNDLLQKINVYIPNKTTTKPSQAPDSQQLDSGNSIALSPKPSQGIAILLLDAENLHLNPEIEKFLTGICTYPLQIKVAFANWRSMGKKDAELHGRGYELIHVPPGKDSADVKMATVGSSIFIHYPTAREVLVCSSDGVLTHLCTTLQTHGLTVYLVRKQGDNLTVLNSQTGQTQTHSLIAPPEIPTVEQFIAQLKDIMQTEQARTGMHWMKLAKLSSAFHAKYKLTITQVGAVHFPEKRAREIFQEFPQDFVLHQLPDRSDLYVTLFQANPQAKTANNNSSSSIGNQHLAQSGNTINSQAELEQVLIKIVQDLTEKAPGSYIPISNVATVFQRQFEQPITKLMKRLQVGNEFPKILQSCEALKVKKVGKVYQVAIRGDAIVETQPQDI